MYLLARIPVIFCRVVFIMGDSVKVFSSPADTEPVEAVFSDALIFVVFFREKIRAVNMRINSRCGCFLGCAAVLWYIIFSFLLTVVFFLFFFSLFR